MNTLSKNDKLKILKFNTQTKLRENKVIKYMNNIVKYNFVLIYHYSKSKSQFKNKCMKMFKNYKDKKNIKLLCNELYTILDDINKNKSKNHIPTTNKTKTNKTHITSSKTKKSHVTSSKKLLGGDIKGPYLQRLTTKGDEPITGDDIARTIDEITLLLNDLQYLDDAPNVKGFNALLQYFNGNTTGLQNYLKYELAPRFYSTFPPSINISKLYDRWDNIVDILNAYKNDKIIKLQFATDKGLKPDDVLTPTFLDKFTDKLNNIDNKYQRFKRVKSRQLVI